jgi:hypothetical protein
MFCGYIMDKGWGVESGFVPVIVDIGDQNVEAHRERLVCDLHTLRNSGKIEGYSCPFYGETRKEVDDALTEETVYEFTM